MTRVVQRRVLASVAGVGLAVASVGVIAPASADEIWVQAFGRASEDAPCVAPADETPWEDTYTGQREWTPSWQQWANGGAGGWVCVRSIVWAGSGGEGDAGASGAPIGCQQGQPGINWLFGTDPWLAAGATRFNDIDCADPSNATSSYVLVYAPDGQAQAETLCAEHGNGWKPGGSLDHAGSSPVWGCVYYP